MKLAIQICSEHEWKSIKSILKVDRGQLRKQPYGDYFNHRVGRHPSLVYHSGATKTRAAAACQFAIDSWHPDAVINLGTCGGVSEKVSRLDIIIAQKTRQYDVNQIFGEPTIRFMKDLWTALDLSWVDLSKVSRKIRIGTIASADQDLNHKQRMKLQREKVITADWESASIAKVCELNRMKCLILRGVTDIPKKHGGLKQDDDYKKNAPIIMQDLLSILSQITFC
jgi:adenosylhomocysteine nucleosidase